MVYNMGIVAVMKEGKLIAQGSYAELSQNSEDFKYLTALDKGKKKGGALAPEKAATVPDAVAEQEKKPELAEEEKKGADSDVATEPEHGEDNKEKSLEKAKLEVDTGKLIEDEKKMSGRVKWSNYMRIFKASGLAITILCFLTFFIEQAGIISLDWWVGIWAANPYHKGNTFYIWRYATITTVEGALVVIRGLLYIQFIMALAKNTQMSMLWSILRAPLQWFDKTPVGRIINRVCKDQADVDNDVVWLVHVCIRSAFLLALSVLLVGYVTYYFFIILGIMLILCFYYYSYSIQAARDSRRIESVAKSPIFVLYEETLDGLSTIRSYRYEEMFTKRMIQRVNHCMNAYFMTTRCVRWLNLRVDALAALMVSGAFYLAVYARNTSPDTNAAMVGLSLSQCLNVINMVAGMLMFFGMLDVKMNSVERVFEYITENPKERDFDEPKPTVENWPTRGEIAINNLYLRYRSDLPFVIKGLSLKVAPHEKVGIAGRTGSGKSTLTLGLLRIMEPVDPSAGNAPEASPCKGTITIDGQDVGEIGLHILRRTIAIIPQDPVLFSGTIKSNLDPFAGPHADREKEMISVLYKSKLIDKIWRKLVEKPAEKSKDKKSSPEAKTDPPEEEEKKLEEPLLPPPLVKARSSNTPIIIPSEYSSLVSHPG